MYAHERTTVNCGEDMHTLAELIDLARMHAGIDSDSALGVRLGKSRQTMSQWRSGLRVPEDDDVVRLAKLAGTESIGWLVIAQAARTSGPAHEVWVALAKKLGTAAAIAMLTFALALPIPANANAMQLGHSQTADDMHYAK